MLWDFDVFSEMERLRREMNNLFSGYEQTAGNATFPLLNVYDSKDNIVVTAELPGLSKDQVKISFADNILTLSGELKALPKSKGMTIVRRERSEGEFEKTLRIPTKVKQDAISASFTNGILTITLPKADDVKPKTIAIEAK
jgi:HSP20 family protein